MIHTRNHSIFPSPTQAPLIREQDASGYTKNLARRFGRITLAELPAWRLLVLSGVVGTAWAASLFDWSFVDMVINTAARASSIDA